MATFTISLAGVSIGVSAIYPATEHFCREYITSAPPQISVMLDRVDIDGERARSARQDALQGIPVRAFSDAYLETLALYRKIAARLLDFNSLVMHGTAVAIDDRAFLFTAPSGTGKTTHAGFWLDRIPGASVLNGDKPLLKITEEEILLCGTPWQGKENLGYNRIVPLAAICILERDRQNHIERISFADALDTLVRQIHKPETPGAVRKILLLLNRFQKVRIYRMGCNMDPSAAEMSYAAMR